MSIHLQCIYLLVYDLLLNFRLALLHLLQLPLLRLEEFICFFPFFLLLLDEAVLEAGAAAATAKETDCADDDFHDVGILFGYSYVL